MSSTDNYYVKTKKKISLKKKKRIFFCQRYFYKYVIKYIKKINISGQALALFDSKSEKWNFTNIHKYINFKFIQIFSFISVYAK